MLTVSTSLGQGFDWQYSSRLPSQYPYYFIGINTNINYTGDNGSLNFAEKEIPCCKFSDGNGVKFGGGLSGEYWLNETMSLVGSLNYSYLSSHFVKKTDPIPRPDDFFQSEFTFDSDLSYLDLDFRFKNRIADSYFSWFGGICGSVLIINTSEHKEKVISKNNSFNDGTTERLIKEGKISSLSSFVIPIKAGISYDFTFGRGKYFTPSIYVMYTMNNIAKRSDWKYYSFGIEITIFHSFLFR
jgi:hypothetical protein